MHALVTMLRWTARCWSVASLLFVLAMATAGAESDARLHIREMLGLLLFPVGVVGGLIVAFKSEHTGGWITVMSLAAFYLWHLAVSGELPQGPFFFIVAAPGFLFLTCSGLQEQLARVTAQSTDHPVSVRRQTPNSTSAVIVVASVHHGNTMLVAQAMAERLNADVLTPDQAAPERLANYDVIGFGSGIYFGRHHRLLRHLVRSLSVDPGRVFIFSTAGLPWMSWLFHSPLRRALTKRGREVIGEFSCRGWDTVGPLFLLGGLNHKHPNVRDLTRASSFADEIGERAREVE